MEYAKCSVEVDEVLNRLIDEFKRKMVRKNIFIK